MTVIGSSRWYHRAYALSEQREFNRLQAPLPLPTLIACMRDRLDVLKVAPKLPIGFVPELWEQAIAHLEEKQRLEASSVL